MNIPQILSYGLSGLCVVLFILSFWLISQEQKRKGQARPAILKTIAYFMTLTVVSTVIVGFLGVSKIEENKTLSNKLHVVEVVRENDRISSELNRSNLSNAAIAEAVQTVQQKNDTIIDQLKNIAPKTAESAQIENNKIKQIQEELKLIAPRDTAARRRLTDSIILKNNRIRIMTNEAIFKRQK